MRLICDTHVHIYKQFSLEACIASAFDNFFKNQPADSVGCICLLETNEISSFDRLATEKISGFSIETTNDKEALLIKDDQHREIFVVTGRQHVTKEKLEVLTIGNALPQIQNRLGLLECLDAAKHSGALVVLPWGFGKWLGRRGVLINSAVDSYPETLLADSALRPNLFSKLKYPKQGEKRPILYGSDPLALIGEHERIGTYNTISEIGNRIYSTPLSSIIGALRNGYSQPSGKRLSTLKSLALQVLLRFG